LLSLAGALKCLRSMWQLIINGPGYFDTPYDLPEGATSVGRADDNDIVLSGDLVSRRHARLEARGERLVVEDLGSRNGSRINGHPLVGTAPLHHGDTLTVGENTLSVRQPSSSESAATEMVQSDAGAVKRFGELVDIGPAVIVSKNVRESVVLRALDNFAPFDLSGRQSPPPFHVQQPITYESLVLLYRVTQSLATMSSLQAFLEDACDKVMDRVRATTAVVLLKDATGTLVPAAVRHRGELAKGEVPVSNAVVQEALASGAALAVGNVREDTRFSERQSVVLYGIDQVLCIPIAVRGEFVGVLYMNRSKDSDEDPEQLVDVCTAVVHLISSGVQKFQSDRAPAPPPPSRLRRTLERFHGPDIVQRRMLEAQEGAGGSATFLEERLVTLLVADLVDFSPLAHRLPPDRTVAILNEFYQRMMGVVFSFEGTVERVVGDALVAFFGAPDSREDDAIRAVRTALAMRAEWEKLMVSRPESERCPLRIGLTTGRALIGVVGSEARYDYTALGEPVDVATWLSASAMPSQVLMTGKTLAAVGARFDVVPLGERILRPPKDKVPVFEVLGEDVGDRTSPGRVDSGA
jgi:class 3 adenylate cyclase